MKILAIDTASKICSVAILEKEELVDEINLDNGCTHSENLMPILAEILTKNQLKLTDIDLISCCTGPGSFTGIRIGVATVKALAEVNHLPVASVTSLETLAKIDGSSAKKIALIDARNNQVYSGIFDENCQALDEFLADDIHHVIEQFKKEENVVFMGDGAILHKDLILQNMPTAKFCDLNEQRAKFGGMIAYQKYLKNDVKNADTIVPTYLRKSQAERLKKEAKEWKK